MREVVKGEGEGEGQHTTLPKLTKNDRLNSNKQKA
jgi:hypothetical protein